MKRVCVFVDGENLRHSIDDLFTSFNNRDYLPKRANWETFYDFIVANADDGSRGVQWERIRTYWYVVRNLDFYPFGIPRLLRDNQQIFLKIISEAPEFATRVSGLEGEGLQRELKKIGTELAERRINMQKRFDGWTNLQDQISNNNKSIEFRRAGSLRYDLRVKELGQEKAVDVKLATDLIVLKDIYDIAVIVSGDQDYVPAVETVKDFGKTVINVAFKTRKGKLLPGGARRLNNVTDWSFHVKYDKLNEHLKIVTT